MHLVVDLNQGGPVCRAHCRRGMRGSPDTSFERLLVLDWFGLDLGGDGAERLFKKRPDLLVFSSPRRDRMPIDDAARISVYHEYRMIPGVQSNRVGGLGADAIQVKKLLAQLGCGKGEQFFQRAFELIIEESDKRFQSCRLLAEIARGTDEALEAAKLHPANSRNAQKLRLPEILEGALHIGPCGVLCQVGSDNNLKLRLRRPPVLRTPGTIELVV